MRAGTPYELVARQLGDADIQMVARVYGRYVPRSHERDKWGFAVAQDEPIESSASSSTPIEKSTKWVPSGVSHLIMIRANHP